MTEPIKKSNKFKDALASLFGFTLVFVVFITVIVLFVLFILMIFPGSGNDTGSYDPSSGF